MQEEMQSAIAKASANMKQAIEHLETQLKTLRTGKASPALVSGVMVDYYGNATPLNQVANVTTGDSRSIVIQPWEKSMLSAIEKAIFESNLGLTPQNDGEVVRLNIPPLTEERRRDLVKQAKALGEDAKVSVRNARRDAMNAITRAVKEGFPEDQGKRRENEVQKATDDHIERIDSHIVNKEKDIMTI